MDGDAFADLVMFARLEVAAADIEPWAAILEHLHRGGYLDDEEALWAVKLYNATDDLGTTWRLRDRWPTPAAWSSDLDHTFARGLPLSRERRNLRGGRITQHLDSYLAHLHGQTQSTWLWEAVPPGATPTEAFGTLIPYLRRVWGVGRQTAFEWCEFVAKVGGLPVEAPDAYLWESSGPRESLERLYNRGAPAPSPQWLNTVAADCRAALAAAGVALTWWDFETVICDFKVMCKGRYYPGQHIAMIREEIEGLPDPHRGHLRRALQAVVPAPWCDVPPGPDKALARAYRDTGAITTPLEGATV